MADTFQYPKKRDKFGRHPQFDDTVTKIVGSVMPNPNQKELYQQRDPNKVILDNIPQYSEHRVSCMSYFSNKILSTVLSLNFILTDYLVQVNTERIPTHNRGMKHVVGGKCHTPIFYFK